MLQPLGDRILIRPEPNPDRTDSGLHLVERRQPETVGEVVAVPTHVSEDCPECLHTIHRPVTVQVGDTVVFSWESGQEILIDDDRYLLMRERDLLAVLEGVT